MSARLYDLGVGISGSFNMDQNVKAAHPGKEIVFLGGPFYALADELKQECGVNKPPRYNPNTHRVYSAGQDMAITCWS